MAVRREHGRQRRSGMDRSDPRSVLGRRRSGRRRQSAGHLISRRGRWRRRRCQATTLPSLQRTSTRSRTRRRPSRGSRSAARQDRSARRSSGTASGSVEKAIGWTTSSGTSPRAVRVGTAGTSTAARWCRAGSAAGRPVGARSPAAGASVQPAAGRRRRRLPSCSAAQPRLASSSRSSSTSSSGLESAGARRWRAAPTSRRPRAVAPGEGGHGPAVRAGARRLPEPAWAAGVTWRSRRRCR
jgi:hypothetical protein